MRPGGAGALLALGCCAGFALLPAPPAEAACTPVSSLATPGTIVTCTGTTNNQDVSVGYGTGAQTGVTINLTATAPQPSPIVTGTNAGILIGGGVVNIPTTGTVTSSGIGDGIDAVGAVALFVNNAGAISTPNTSFAAIAGNNAVVVVNSGIIDAGSTGFGSLGVIGLNVNVANAKTGVMTADIVLFDGGGTTVFANAGSMVGANYGVEAHTTIAGANSGLISGGIDAIRTDAANATINLVNSGSITGGANGGGAGYGVNTNGGGSIVITNTAGGVISGPTGGIAGGNISLTNSGTVIATGPAGSGSMGVSGGTLNIVNNASGVITGGDIGLSGGAGSLVTNAGTISGGVAIALSSNSVVVNSGLVTTGDGGFGIFSPGDANVITNTASGIITAGANSASGVNLLGDGNLVTNAGKVIVGDEGFGINVAGDANRIVNTGSIVAGVDGLGIGANLGDSNVVVNNGSIKVGAFSSFNATGIALGDSGAVTNNGSIVGGAGAFGITATTGSIVVNTGTIVVGDFGFGITVGDHDQIINNGTVVVGRGSPSIGVNVGFFSSLVNNGVVIGGPGAFGIVAFGLDTITNNGLVRVGAGGLSVFSGGGNTVLNAGTLDGTLSMSSGDTLVNSGLIEITDPGTPIGAPHSAGDSFTQTASGTLALRVDAAGDSDSLFATSAHLGGTLRAVVQPGLYANVTPYDGVVVACSCTGLNGTKFDTVASSSPFFLATATYDYAGVSPPVFDPNVSLTLTRLPFGGVPGATRNEQAVGKTLDTFYSTGLTGNAATFYSNLLAATSLNALDQLSGEGATGAQDAAFGAGDTFLTMMSDQGAFWRSGSTIDANGAVIPGKTNYAADDPQAPALKAIAIKPADPYQPRWRAWTAGFDGAWSLRGEGDPGSADLTQHTAAGAVGLDYQVDPNILLGLAAGVSGSSFSVVDRATSGTVDGAHFGTYGVWRGGPWYASGSLAFSLFDNKITRTISGVGPTEVATGSFNSNMFSGRAEVGYKQAFANYSITPFAAVQFSELWQAGYGETSTTLAGAPGTLGLTYSSKTIPSLPSFLGAQFDTEIALPNGMVWSPYARLSWLHEFEPTRDITASFVTLPGTSFTVDGASAASNALRVSLGSKVGVAPNAALFVALDGEFSDRGAMYAGRGGIKVTW